MRCGVAGGERVPPAPLGWYFVDVVDIVSISEYEENFVAEVEDPL